MHETRNRGLAIPDELSLVGFDSMPINELLGPPLTSVAQPIDGLGRIGAERLLALLGESAVSKPQTLRLGVSLVERGSVVRRGDPSHQQIFPEINMDSVAGDISLAPT